MNYGIIMLWYHLSVYKYEIICVSVCVSRTNVVVGFCSNQKIAGVLFGVEYLKLKAEAAACFSFKAKVAACFPLAYNGMWTGRDETDLC